MLGCGQNQVSHELCCACEPIMANSERREASPPVPELLLIAGRTTGLLGAAGPARTGENSSVFIPSPQGPHQITVKYPAGCCHCHMPQKWVLVAVQVWSFDFCSGLYPNAFGPDPSRICSCKRRSVLAQQSGSCPRWILYRQAAVCPSGNGRWELCEGALTHRTNE